MAFNADVECAVCHGTRNAQDYVAIIYLAIVQSYLGRLIDFSVDQLCCTSDAAAIFATIWQVNTLIPEAVQQGLFGVNLVGLIATIGDVNLREDFWLVLDLHMMRRGLHFSHLLTGDGAQCSRTSYTINLIP